ncbi:MAG: hypothetical protein WC773_02655 [Patescibacteria group bacterium]|jgi:hypothetical protein
MREQWFRMLFEVALGNNFNRALEVWRRYEAADVGDTVVEVLAVDVIHGGSEIEATLDDLSKGFNLS